MDARVPHILMVLFHPSRPEAVKGRGRSSGILTALGSNPKVSPALMWTGHMPSLTQGFASVKREPLYLPHGEEGTLGKSTAVPEGRCPEAYSWMNSTLPLPLCSRVEYSPDWGGGETHWAELTFVSSAPLSLFSFVCERTVPAPTPKAC